MPRTITVSTDVFAAIWAKREDGEENEDQILQRIFGCKKNTTDQISHHISSQSGGVYDSRNNVHFPQGFKIFRMYKGKEYCAIAQDGVWVREGVGGHFPTLNQLNHSIAAGNENVWNGNWKYRTEDGSIRPISDRRPK
ncbi:hypothetical protein [Paremcibacter congregatus]|uniref:Uncharacterized protein n=1 Tax=Paremcibacter congregatus TaxID=2043170 RepID=A0A2G4YR01_9PROT|nr:hypothetical protein [Paremcibacter congregatus]PHZ84764.1 hypothetical protein CRD36_10795 [Paremcibacter congregatus]QDE28956.1 hypothetical protein FIV45_17560 [Paremcibacter congregatus]